MGTSWRNKPEVNLNEPKGNRGDILLDKETSQEVIKQGEKKDQNINDTMKDNNDLSKVDNTTLNNNFENSMSMFKDYFKSPEMANPMIRMPFPYPMIPMVRNGKITLTFQCLQLVQSQAIQIILVMMVMYLLVYMYAVSII